MQNLFGCLGNPGYAYKMGCGSSMALDEEPLHAVVFGATGMVGGAVAHSLLKNRRFRVKAITRTPTSQNAHTLAEKGACISTANLNDLRSLERVLAAADCVFLTTHYWEHMNKDKELQQGMNAIDAAVQCNVRHIVFYGSESAKELTGKDCGHFDAKAAIEEYIKERGLPYTILHLPFFYENLLTVFKPHRMKENVYAVALPLEDTYLDCMSVSDIGRCVMKIFLKPKVHINKTIGLSVERLTIYHIADSLGKHFEDKKFICPRICVKDYEKFEFKGSKDIAAMFDFYQKTPLIRDANITKKICHAVVTFDRWVHDNKDKINEVLKTDEET